MMFFTDAMPLELEEERRELLERRAGLRGDPDPETKSEIGEIERALRGSGEIQSGAPGRAEHENAEPVLLKKEEGLGGETEPRNCCVSVQPWLGEGRRLTP